MARRIKSTKRRRSQAKKTASAFRRENARLKREIASLKRAAARRAKSEKRAGVAAKRAAKRLRIVTGREKVRASTRKLPVIRGPSFQLFAPLRRMKRSRAAQIRREVGGAEEKPKRATEKEKKRFWEQQKQLEISSIERTLRIRRRWLKENDEASIPAKQKKSARRKLNAEISGLLRRLERVENELFRGYKASIGNRAKKKGAKSTKGRKKVSRKNQRSAPRKKP